MVRASSEVTLKSGKQVQQPTSTGQTDSANQKPIIVTLTLTPDDPEDMLESFFEDLEEWETEHGVGQDNAS